MAEGTPRTGLVVSGAIHFALLAILVLGLSRATRFDDAPESIPVETITTTELNEIMEGEKQGKPAPVPAKPAPAPPQTSPEPTPQPPTPEPPRRPPPPPDTPPPPEPPTRPQPPAPEPPKRPEPPPPPAPTPPPRPQPPTPPKAEDAPTPPVKPTTVAKAEPPRPPEKPRAAPKPEPQKPDKFKPDEIAKTLDKEAEEKPRPAHTAAFDPAAISKAIGQTRTADASSQPAQTPQGLANHHAQRMSVSLENALNEWFRDSYKNCWNLPPNNPSGDNYVFNVRVSFNPDGSLSGRPVMLNPPTDPEWRAHADSVMRAVMRCNPLHIPTQYAPFFDQWKSKTIHFDPTSAEG